MLPGRYMSLIVIAVIIQMHSGIVENILHNVYIDFVQVL